MTKKIKAEDLRMFEQAIAEYEKQVRKDKILNILQVSAFGLVIALALVGIFYATVIIPDEVYKLVISLGK